MKDCTAPFSVQNAIFSFRAAAIVRGYAAVFAY